MTVLSRLTCVTLFEIFVKRKCLSETSNDDCLLMRAFPCALGNVQLFPKVPIQEILEGMIDHLDYLLPLVGLNVDDTHYIDDDDDDDGNEYLVVQLWPLEQMKTSLTPFHHSCACDLDDALQ